MDMGITVDSKGEIAIILVSGGMDSLVTACIAKEEYKAEMAFLHVSYGQRTEKRELKAFHDIADFFQVKRRLACNIEYLKYIGGSSLTDLSIDVSRAQDSLGKPEIPLSYVPFRNTHFLAIATSWAEVIGAKFIFIGAVEEDSSGYPDCRETYYHAFNKLIAVGTRPETKIEVVTPLIHYKKKEIILKGIALKAPFELTWSCYQREDISCGTCESCYLRIRGFKEARIPDPLDYADSL